ncbi:MAG: phytanoyl-CoA dioxygenase family protein [Candidatus Obscuribacterales bacterium]|nr:phytanoyl-CoA dioxygenase family protein [Candidatus Obscuribacterales bacterium]
MNILQTSPAVSSEELRHKIYSGVIYKNNSSKESNELIQAVLAIVQEKCGNDYRLIHTRPSAEAFRLISDMKNSVYKNSDLLLLLQNFLLQSGLIDPETEYYIDPPRLRVILHDGHLDHKTRIAYAAHRDTWYANSQSQINIWLALHDVSEIETLSFFPDYFNQPIANDSAEFNYDRWIHEVGFGNSQSGKTNFYPMAADILSEIKQVGFSVSAGEPILFSASHLHASNPNSSGLTRFSIDFRFVHAADHEQGLGAPNKDNASSGSALKDYLKFGAR